MFLSWLLLRETIDLTMIIGAAVIIVSVWIVIRTEARKPRLSAGAVEAEPVA